MAFPFAEPGDPEYVDNSSKNTPASQPAAKAPPASGPNRTQNLHPRSVRPFSTTKLVPKTASATTLLKIAHTKTARTWGEYLFGNGISSAFDPNQRGMAVDMAAYSNPVSGTIFGLNDTARHLWNGNWGNAAGSLGMMGLSFLPGAGAAGAMTRGGMAAAKGVAKGVAGAAAKGGVKAVAAPVAKTMAGRAGQMVGQAARTAYKPFDVAHKAISAPFNPTGIIGRNADAVVPNVTNAMSAFGRRSGLQAVDNAAVGVRNWARGGQQLMQQNKMLRYPAMGAGYVAHDFGVNPTGESTSDINTRLQSERQNLQQELQQMGYGGGGY